MIYEHSASVEDLPERIADFKRQQRPPVDATRAILDEALEEIFILRKLLEESTSALKLRSES